VAFWVVLCLIGTARAEFGKVYDINLPAQSVAAALNGLSEQTGVSVVFPYDLARDRRSHPVVGRFPLLEALELLLEDTGLSGGLSDKGVLTISPSKSRSYHQREAEVTQNHNDLSESNPKMPRAGAIAAFLASVAATFSVSAQNADRVATSDQSANLSEIIVTAQKREERLQDVPIPVTVLNAQSLVENNQVRLTDYYSSVPGLVVSDSFLGQPSLSIRGISTGAGFFTNPTVGITVDGLPYGSSTPSGGGSIVPDLDPSDLARIEVLRGPQGTLYGASSLGGLVKYETLDPSMDRVSGRLESDVISIDNGNGQGYAVRGAVNIPLSNEVAIRASGFTRVDPGYIDNVETGVQGVNRDDAYGGRLSGLWKPSDAFSLKLGAFLQDNKSAGLNAIVVGPGIGPLQQTSIPNGGASERRYEVFSANISAKVGRFDLTSITGYGINTLIDSIGETVGSQASLAMADFGVGGGLFVEHNKTSKFTQELRIATSILDRADIVLGGFYDHESSPYHQNILAENLETGAIAGDGLCFCWKDTYQEYAAFTDITLHFTDQFNIQLGARESHSEQSYTETDTGPYTTYYDGGPSPVAYGLRETSDNAFTYLVTPQFKFSPDFMAYVRLASGYRPGGPQALPVSYNVPNGYRPDKTQNYEVGFKGDLLNHLVSVDASAYYIDWKDIQLTGEINDLAYLANGSRATSRGVELSSQLNPFAGLVIAGWVAFNEAKLTEPLLPGGGLYGNPGDGLPDSARFSGNLSADEQFPIRTDITGFVGGALSYVGAREGLFASSATTPRSVYPAYAKMDLHGGVIYDTWKVSLFANNVTNRLGVLTNDFAPYVFIIQPRTIGLSVAKTF
jgi:iron complex outermembrane recepter protein